MSKEYNPIPALLKVRELILYELDLEKRTGESIIIENDDGTIFNSGKHLKMRLERIDKFISTHSANMNP